MSGVVKYVGLIGVAVVLAVMALRLTSLGSGDNTPQAQAPTTSPATPGTPPTSAETPAGPTPQTTSSPTTTGPGASYAREVKRSYRDAISTTSPKPLWRVYVGEFTSGTPGRVAVHTTLGSQSSLNSRFARYVCDFLMDHVSASVSPVLRSAVVLAQDGVAASRCGRADST
jgi:hypothetical protein